MAIYLRPITSENWIDCIELQPTVEQQQAGSVASNTLSLAQAYAVPWRRPFAIYADEEIVGFVMYGRRWGRGLAKCGSNLGIVALRIRFEPPRCQTSMDT